MILQNTHRNSFGLYQIPIYGVFIYKVKSCIADIFSDKIVNDIYIRLFFRLFAFIFVYLLIDCIARVNNMLDQMLCLY